jgi:hypothetical protein
MGLAQRLQDEIRKAADQGDVQSPQNIEIAVNVPGDDGPAVATAHQDAPIVQTTRREKRVDRPR